MIRLATEGGCTGCSACANVCPVNAIEMIYSEKGFLIPSINNSCIECRKCIVTCPVLTPKKNDNDLKPLLYAFCADDDVREKSSSGGMFTILAEYVLERRGFICGACFDDEMRLRHILTQDRAIIDLMRGSKYLQSSIGLSYRETKEKLDAGSCVLYVGTPCQIAGLKSFLSKDYDDLLITIDLLCHGTPSQKFFDSYICEIAKGKKVKNVIFRSKRWGWSWSNIVTVFEDGTEYIGWKNTDPYKNAFSRHLMTRWSCYECIFATYPRQGDITIGDLWEPEKLDPMSNDKKGTSLVFINSKNGEAVFSNVISRAKYVNKIVIDDDQYDEIPNRVTPKTWRNPNRTRFLELVKRLPFSKAVNDSLNDHYDIGMPGVFFTNNIGSLMTYFALFCALKDLGYDIRTFERTTDAETKNYSDSQAFIKKWMPKYAYPIQYSNITEMSALNNKCDVFVVGSDQIYLESMNHFLKDIFFLQYIDGNRKKITYASSFGGPRARGTDDYIAEMKYYLNRFSALSFREDDGVNYANNVLKTRQTAVWAIDPVFLCDKKYFLEIANVGVEFTDKKIIGAYILKPHGRNKKLLRKLCNYFGVDASYKFIYGLDVSNGFFAESDKQIEVFRPFPVENALSIIRNSEFFITDSFHGMCFCIIFQVDFLVIPRDFSDRFMSLLKRIGLEERIIDTDLSNLSNDSFSPIAWDKVYNKLEKLIENSLDYLRCSIDGKGIQDWTDYDAIMYHIRMVQKERKRIREEEEKNYYGLLDRISKIEEKMKKMADIFDE